MGSPNLLIKNKNPVKIRLFYDTYMWVFVTSVPCPKIENLYDSLRSGEDQNRASTVSFFFS